MDVNSDSLFSCLEWPNVKCMWLAMTVDSILFSPSGTQGLLNSFSATLLAFSKRRQRLPVFTTSVSVDSVERQSGLAPFFFKNDQ